MHNVLDVPRKGVESKLVKVTFNTSNTVHPSGHYPCHVVVVVVPKSSRLIGVEGLKRAIRRISLVFQYLSTLWTTRARIIDYHNQYLYNKCSYLNGLVYFVVTLESRS